MADLTSLEEVKGWLNITNGNSDAKLRRLVSSVSQFVQTWLNRNILSAEYTLVRDGSGRRTLLLPNSPITAISSLKVDGVAIQPYSEASGTGYKFSGSLITLIGAYFTRDLANVEVTYTGGYDEVPTDIEQACIELIALRLKELERVGIESKSIGGESVSFLTKDMPSSVLTVLQNYKAVAPI